MMESWCLEWSVFVMTRTDGVVPGTKGTLGNKRYLCFQVDILDMTYQLSTLELTTIIPIVAAGSENLIRLIGTTRKTMPPSILR